MSRWRKGNDSLPDTNAVALTAGGTPGQSSTAAGDRGDTAYLQAQQQLLLLRVEQQELGRYLRPNHPKMIAMQEDIARREELLKILRTQSEEQLKNRKELLAVEIEILEKDLKAWDARNQEFQHKNAEYQALKANVQRIRALRPVAGHHADAGCQQRNKPGERRNYRGGVMVLCGAARFVEEVR